MISFPLERIIRPHIITSGICLTDWYHFPLGFELCKDLSTILFHWMSPIWTFKTTCSRVFVANKYSLEWWRAFSKLYCERKMFSFLWILFLIPPKENARIARKLIWKPHLFHQVTSHNVLKQNKIKTFNNSFKKLPLFAWFALLQIQTRYCCDEKLLFSNVIFLFSQTWKFTPIIIITCLQVFQI